MYGAAGTTNPWRPAPQAGCVDPASEGSSLWPIVRSPIGSTPTAAADTVSGMRPVPFQARPAQTSITFTALVAGNLALILVNRSWRLTVWETFRQRHNRTLWILVPIVALLVMLLAVPGVRSAFNFGPMAATEWLIATAAGMIGVTWFEVNKLTSSMRERS